jgi:hypothetical protein
MQLLEKVSTLEKVKTFVLKRATRLLPERSEHEEPRSEQFARLLIGFLLVLGMLCLVVVLVVLTKLLIWLSAELAPWTGYITYVCWAVVIVILTPLTFIRRTKASARLGLLFAACLFGAILLLGSIDLLYSTWGVFAVFVGLCLFGVGVVPLAFLKALITTDWSSLFGLLVLLASAAGVAFAARRMESKHLATSDVRNEIVNQSELG